MAVKAMYILSICSYGKAFPDTKASIMMVSQKHLLQFLAIAGTTIPVTAAHAQEEGVAYAGASVSEGYNAYAGALIALPGNSLGDGLAIRGGVSGGRYEYDTAGVEIEADYVTGELALVYQTSGDWGWANFSAGPRITDTSLSPMDPNNGREGTRVDLALQTDGAYGRKWRLDWFGSLGVFDKAYFTEVRFGPEVSASSGTRIGLETGFQGDDFYSSRKVGAFASTRLGGGWEGRISGGASKLEDRSAKAYGTVSFSKVF